MMGERRVNILPLRERADTIQSSIIAARSLFFDPINSTRTDMLVVRFFALLNLPTINNPPPAFTILIITSIQPKPARSASKEKTVNQSKLETFEYVCNVIAEMFGKIIRILVGVAGLAGFVALCALPFILIEDKSKVSFWYSTGAFGVYLVGVSQILGRRI